MQQTLVWVNDLNKKFKKNPKFKFLGRDKVPDIVGVRWKAE
jgi:hypothetical protein